MGYHQAWPDAEIVGVDLHPQPRYPFTFVQGDATACPLDGFDFVHASPPCHDHSALRSRTGLDHGTGWMLEHTLARLEAWGGPWVVENVDQADFGPRFKVRLCGSSFGLKVRRHRWFASNALLVSLPCDHAGQGQPLGVYGTGGGGQMTRGRKATPAEARDAMGIDWMNRYEISQAIPPAYTRFLADQLRPTTPTAPRPEPEGRCVSARHTQRTDPEGAHGG